ncbi:MAG TPA: CHRD domain-containing protein [Vicinamibacterales bacterium]
MRRTACVLGLAVSLIGFDAALVAGDDDHARGRNQLRARLKAENEVPVVISPASGEFRARVNREAQTIEYQLSYSALEGTVLQAHIHAGQPFASGGIMIWLCANNPPITAAPAGTQPCPEGPATITGVITAADVVGPAGQAIPVGAFEDALRAIRSGNAYVNVHSTSAPGGEIRGQIQ